MIVRQSLADVPPGERAVALGSFDGVHRGHQAVIGNAVSEAGSRGLKSAVITFHPPPIAVLRPDIRLIQLSTLSRRAALVAELGVDELVILRFDRAFSTIDADGFAEQVLAGTLGARHVSVGENFHYGRGAKGTPAKLAEDGARLGFEVHVEPLLQGGGGTISSSRIRELLGAGAVEKAGELLGRPPWLEGAVVRGDGRGRELGYPTANLALVPRSPVPGTGIYAGAVHLPGSSHPAAISVGYNVTFTDDRSQVRVEAYLLDFDADIYGSPIRIDLTHRLRDELRFDSVDALLAQLRRDVEAVRTLAE
ncbi:MAG TPA: bifunctional riboflavin kinase/FAD synthetase [Gaiellales bacterium]|nr:bifunctional riboflavin kinase/FAD synthetase [Gaiellales bacterium]